MVSLLQEIEHTYVTRCDNRSEFKSLWENVASMFPPDISKYADAPRPSLLLALEAGDLGLSIMWIVQTAVIRPILCDLGIHEIVTGNSTTAVSESSIGALAHSEDKNFPATICEKAGRISISGKKKYITGGTYADFLLVTARKEGEDAVSTLLAIPQKTLSPESFQKINLPMLRTIEHASLDLHHALVPQSSILPIAPSHLRQLLKRWSIIERGFIAEAYIGLCMYIAVKLENIHLIPHGLHIEIKSLLERINENVTEMLNAALSGLRVPEILPFNEIIMSYVELKDSIPPVESLPLEIALRFADLVLFEKILS